MDIGEIGQNKVIGLLTGMRGVCRCPLIAIVNTSIVTVMAISNIDGTLLQRLLELRNKLGIGNPPHPVSHPLKRCIKNWLIGLCKVFHQAISSFGFVGIEPKNTADIGFGFSEKVEAVSLGARKRFFMREYLFIREIMQTHGGKKAAAGMLNTVGIVKSLKIGVDGWHGIVLKLSRIKPLTQSCGCRCIRIALHRQFKPYCIERRTVVERLLLRRRDNVVRRTNQFFSDLESFGII